MGTRRTKRRKIPHFFSKAVVLWCVIVATVASAYSMIILHRTGADATSLLSVILAFFGGELMVLCLRTILGDRKKKKESEETYGTDL